jgi:uncharacterized membrane protein
VTMLVCSMLIAGATALLLGLILARNRFAAASGFAARLLVLGPVFEATALAIFAAEHFFAARDMMVIVPRWMPAPLFWTWFVGVALLAAAVSFLAWRYVRLSSSMLALLFFIIVATVDLHILPKHLHERLFWTLTARETSFAVGAMVLAASLWPRGAASRALILIGRILIAATFVFYAVQQGLFPHFAPGVPLAKLTPSWVPAPTALAYLVSLTLLVCGIGLLIPRTVRLAAAIAGTVLLALTVFLYGPIMLMELHTKLAVEGINYVGDTMLFAATALLAGYGARTPS